MCEKCGCGEGEGFNIHDPHHSTDHKSDQIQDHDHKHDHGHTHSHEHPHKLINLNVDILAGNNITAAMNRRFFEGRKVLCLNMVSSPGSGKTTILEKTIGHLTRTAKIYVIEGDQQTLLDAERIERAGAPAIQINTGSGCHLDAHMVESALKKLEIETNSLLFIENVGNLVCPAMFDLGENRRVVVMSVTEGEDKPLKYPYMFQTSHLCIINKSDLLPYVDFRIEEAMKHARSVNPDLEFISVSAKTSEGMNLWYDWILSQKVI
ncbi:MAG: hydrogenase nickel incorporation protein HypB [Bacteroidales bacterium]|jgi:hydrogenase nickel incorporation protein HypB|nr:hydrogenase nickel incorporation protein HypB [Bacteroidales bacterium]